MAISTPTIPLGRTRVAGLNGLAAAITAVGSNGHIVVTDAQAVTTALTVPAGVTLEVKQGGQLTFSGAGSLAFATNGRLAAGPYRTFAGTAGAVALGYPWLQPAQEARPEWWGGAADAGVTDNRTAFDAMLASGANVFRLSPGEYHFRTADANGNAVTIAVTGGEFFGAGYASTFLVVDFAATWGVKATVSQVRCHGFTLQVNSGGSVTYGVGVGTAASGSAESCAFWDILELRAGTGAVANGFALGPDHPGSSSMDIAECTFTRCRADGPHTNAGFLIGNGTSGNVLANQMLHCNANNALYGVYGNASGYVWRDGAVSNNSVADFSGSLQGSDPIVVDGVRSELSAALWYMSGGAAMASVAFRAVTYNGTALKASGRWVEHDEGGVFELRNVACILSGAVTPVVYLHPGSLLVANLSGVASQAAFPGAFDVAGPAGTVAVVSGYSQVNADLTIAAATPFALLGPAGGGGQVAVKVVGSGLSVAEGTNAKQGVATLAAGTVVVANTAVTASSRVQLTAQDNSTTGALRVSARTAGTSFTITSSNAADTGVVAYELFEPA